eukprot:5332454-Pyramimonas_sp.AAC.1
MSGKSTNCVPPGLFGRPLRTCWGRLRALLGVLGNQKSCSQRSFGEHVFERCGRGLPRISRQLFWP